MDSAVAVIIPVTYTSLLSVFIGPPASFSLPAPFPRMPRSSSSLKSVLVTLPNSVVHNFHLPESATGMDCLEKVCNALFTAIILKILLPPLQICSLLGIVEVDYFGLRYVDHHGIYLWVNLRMNLSMQIKTASTPIQLYLKVKYYVDPQTLQQPSTR